ncbi:TIGR01777 family oxidoreductase [Cellulomonas sp. SLBN-39]|uniref:TIGR01777 family oxidoreductase n=1 Tax=Cellulomonas sp. SLBN-39 TaxID=2768446 RepID=UPI001154AB33|nr:TIGR01777 family oxidoreductase [Cellulomonas sp. SLBN-39]TQL03896.1 hypothetical protein FBY24_3006 [Cellulomonas sp. SLBN-39]
MRVVVAGSSGLIGTALCRHLTTSGHDVVRLVRRAPSSPSEIRWDPARDELDPAALAGADAVVDLAGVNVGTRPLTRARKREVVDSRVQTAGLLSRTIARLPDGPGVLLQGSGIGAYGDRGEDLLTEDEPIGTTFFAEVVREWEAATRPAQDAGARVALLRTSIVLSPHGGALSRLLLPLRAGVAARLGSGRQWWSWITLEDEVRAIEHLLTADVHGPVNLLAAADRHADVLDALAREWGARLTVPAPEAVLRLVLQDFASEVVGSIRAVPQVLTASGFTPRHPDVRTAAAWVREQSRRAS